MDFEPEYLDPDEEFERMHSEELDILNDIKNDRNSCDYTPRRSLNFNDIVVRKPASEDLSKFSPNKDVSRPSTSKDTRQFYANNDVSRPSTSWDVSQPSTSKDTRQFYADNDVSRPSTSCNVSRPSTSLDVSQPSTSKDTRQFYADNDVSRPSTSWDVSRPSTSWDASQPSTSKDTRQFYADNDISRPSTSWDVSQPSTSKDTRQFYADNGVSRPSTSWAHQEKNSDASPFPNLNLQITPEISKSNESVSRINGICNNKRAIDELFGDINDIDFLENTEIGFGANKRSKTSEPQKDKDLLMISRIQEKRKKMQENEKILSSVVCYEVDFEPQKLEVTLSRRVPKWAFITLRNGKGEKFYARLHSDEALNNKIVTTSEQCKNFRLLSIPFEKILLEANEIVDKKFVREEQQSCISKNLTADMSNNDVTDLWVEKYKPASYIDLLSDEETNRILLMWIKLWDKIVFNRENPVKMKEIVTKKVDTRFRWKTGPQLDEVLDESGCPKHKIALLCGPPGLGKTTLAHLLSRHAGYNVVEVNASDDRNPEAFRLQLEAATQMQSVIGRCPKPNCLILDEIDGTPSASIEVLIKFVKGEGKRRSKKKSSKSGGVVKRPIICICNDVYVPALRPLRQMAFVIHFPPTDLSRLAQRLVDIAQKEHINADTSAMLALCKKASNDIRTCLSTIYCLKNQPITLATIEKTNIGSKDMHKGLFTVWQEMFQIQKTNIMNNTSDIHQDNKKTETEIFLSKRMQSILRTVQGNGDYDRLIQGVYENFLNVKFQGNKMLGISKGLKWFCFVDEIKTSILSSQNYTIMPYMPYCFVIWHFLFSSYQKPKLTYPNMLYEIITRQTKYRQIVQEVLKDMDPKIRAYCHPEQLLMETLPYLTNLLNPNLRSISVKLFSNNEKEALNQLINTMIDYNLNYIQERTEDGSYEFIIDPNVDEVVNFPNLPKSKRLTYFLKSMISREIKQEKLRRLENISSTSSSNSNITVSQTKKDSFTACNNGFRTESPKKDGHKRRQNHLEKLTPKRLKKCPPLVVIVKDFFGRIVDKSMDAKMNAAKVDEIVKSDVWYHFKEGYSNAVRRTVYISDLL